MQLHANTRNVWITSWSYFPNPYFVCLFSFEVITLYGRCDSLQLLATKNCVGIGDCKTGKLLNSIAEKKGYFDPAVENQVANSILTMYIKCRKVNDG
jgi:hypothetical protein